MEPPRAGRPWATLGGAAAQQVSHNTGSDPCSTATFGPPVVSPDAAHSVVAGGAGCGDAQEHSSDFIVSVSSGTMTLVPGSDSLTNARSVGWLDNNTIWLANGSVSTYVLGAAGATRLPGITDAIEAVVRGDIIYFLAGSSAGSSGADSGTLHRYSLSSHLVLDPAISLGSLDLPTDRSPGDFGFQGWDVSSDGSRIVYQITTTAPVTTANPAGIGSSRVYQNPG